MSEQEVIDQFISIVGNANPEVAQHILEAHGWDLESSVNFFLESGGVGFGNEASNFDYQSPHPAARPLPASAPPRSSPIEILDEDEDDLNDDAVLAASLSRRMGSARHRQDVFDDDDWVPVERQTGSDMSVDSSDDEDLVEDADPIELLDEAEEFQQQRRRIRRNRPSGAAAVDPMLPQRSRGNNNRPHNINPETVDLVGGSGEPEEPLELPDDVDLEEQRMLMAALMGEEYRGRIPDFRTDPRYRPQQLSPGAMAREQLRQEQDAAYHESLAADRRKVEEAERLEREAREAEETAMREKESQEREAAQAAAALERTLTTKEASLPEEPAADAQDAVQIVVRMPGGGRLSRRFRQTDPLSAVFDFVDVTSGRGNKELQPGTYNLVAQFPRRCFEDGGSGTLADADLAHKQEALFIEMKD